MVIQDDMKLKADRPHPCDYPHTPTNYRQADKHLRLVITPIVLYCAQQGCRSNGSAVIALTNTHTNTHGRTDGRYQVHYLPRFAVDNDLYRECRH